MNPMLILASHSILDASKGVDFGQFIQAILSVICLLIDSVVYYVVSIAFKLFLAISQFQIFSDSAFNDLINRTYVVIGVISLFLVAYALLNAIIDPDNASKGDKSISKIVKNIIIAIIGIAIVPTVFNWFYEFQSRVLCNNTIPKILLNKVDSDGSTVENTATQFAAYLFESFFYPNSTSSVDGDAVDKSTALKNVKLNIEDPIPAAERNFDVTEYTLDVAYKHAEEGKSFFRVFRPFIFGNWFDNSIVDNTVQYLVILSTIAGGYCAYVLISLCIDMGLRAVKLGYLELIAPLAIMTKIVPGKDSVFKNWSKKTVSCALEVFVRLFIVVFVIYLINTIKDIELVSLGSKICGLKIGWFLVGILRALIYTSLFAFIKKAPKFFSEATGIKSDGFKIGLMDKMKENGMIQGLGAAGSFATTAIRGGFSGFKNGGLAGMAAGAVKSVPQALKAGQKGWKKTSDIKKWSDVKSGINTATTEAAEEHEKWRDYKKSHGNSTISAIGSKVASAMDDFLNDPESAYKRTKNQHDKLSSAVESRKSFTDWTETLLSKKGKDFQYNGKTWEQLNQEKDLAVESKSKALKNMADANLLVGDDSYTEEAVVADRKAADKEVERLENLSKLVLPKDQKEAVDRQLQVARNRQTAAYAKQADYSKTKAGVAEIQSKASENLKAANAELDSINKTLKDAKKDIDQRILNDEFNSVIKDDDAHELQKHISDMRTKITDALPELVNDSNYSEIKSAVESETNDKLYKAIGDIKDANYAVDIKLNEYGDAIRKKSENKK